MRKVQIITDSCSDLTGELMDRYGVDYAKMNTVRDGVTAPADLRWSREEIAAFYNALRAGERITTTQVPVEEFERIFTEYLEKDCDIVYIGCSLKQSGSVNTGAVVARKLLEKYPGAAIRCIDSLRASAGEGILAIEGAKLAASGKSVDEVAAEVTAMRLKLLQFVTVPSLDALRRAGRVKASKAFFGNLMGVKPILTVDCEGYQTPYKKIKGHGAALKECVRLLTEMEEPASVRPIYMADSDCTEEDVETMTGLVREAFPGREIIRMTIGPIIGASVGPDTIGVWNFASEPFTFRGSDEG